MGTHFLPSTPLSERELSLLFKVVHVDVDLLAKSRQSARDKWGNFLVSAGISQLVLTTAYGIIFYPLGVYSMQYTVYLAFFVLVFIALNVYRLSLPSLKEKELAFTEQCQRMELTDWRLRRVSAAFSGELDSFLSLNPMPKLDGDTLFKESSALKKHFATVDEELYEFLNFKTQVWVEVTQEDIKAKFFTIEILQSSIERLCKKGVKVEIRPSGKVYYDYATINASRPKHSKYDTSVVGQGSNVALDIIANKITEPFGFIFDLPVTLLK